MQTVYIQASAKARDKLKIAVLSAYPDTTNFVDVDDNSFCFDHHSPQYCVAILGFIRRYHAEDYVNGYTPFQV